MPLLSQATPKIDSKLLNDQEALEKVINRIQFGGDEVVKAKDGAGSATVRNPLLLSNAGHHEVSVIKVPSSALSFLWHTPASGMVRYSSACGHPAHKRLFRFVESLIKAKYEGKSGVIEDTCKSFCFLRSLGHLPKHPAHSPDIHISAHPSAAKALSGLTKDTEGIEFFSLPVELGPDGVKDVHVLGQVTPHEQKLLAACVGELKGNIEKVRTRCWLLLAQRYLAHVMLYRCYWTGDCFHPRLEA